MARLRNSGNIRVHNSFGSMEQVNTLEVQFLHNTGHITSLIQSPISYYLLFKKQRPSCMKFLSRGSWLFV